MNPCTTSDLYKDLIHRDCGGAIYKGTDRWSCKKCNHPGWYAHKVRRMDNAQLADRFERAPEVTNGNHVLVWMIDGTSKTRYTALVPASEAHKHERWSYGR